MMTSSSTSTHVVKPHAAPLFRSASMQASRSPQTPASAPPVDQFAASRIPDEIYHKIFLNALKNDLHVHQSGSSSIAFLKYGLRLAIKRGEIRELPLFKQDGTVEVVHFKKQLTNADLAQPFLFQDMFEEKNLEGAELRDAMEKVLSWENLREYFRFQMQIDNNKLYIPSQQINETTARDTGAPLAFDFSGLKKDGLNAYRNTSLKINPFVKNDDAAYIIAYEYARDIALENVRYTEYRVSPAGNSIGGNYNATTEDILSSVYQGFEDARNALNRRDYNLDYGIVVLFERQGKPGDHPTAKVERAKKLAEDVVRLKKEGKYNIVGVDLAGNEADNPAIEFKEAFDIIKRYNESLPPEKASERLGITIHAGETDHSSNKALDIHREGWQSIEDAINIASSPNTPVRIGHGLQVVNSSKMLRQAFQEYIGNPNGWQKKFPVEQIIKSSPILERIVREGIVLEMCPKSNLQTYGINPSVYGILPDHVTGHKVRNRLNKAEDLNKYTAATYALHPAVFLSRLGVKVSISTDNRTISNSDTPNEFVKLWKYAGLTYDDFKKMVMNGFEGAFIFDAEKKNQVIREALGRFRQMERNPGTLKAIRLMGKDFNLYENLLLARIAVAGKVRSLLARAGVIAPRPDAP